MMTLILAVGWVALLSALLILALVGPSHIDESPAGQVFVPMITVNQIVADSEEIFEDYQADVVKYVSVAYEESVSAQLDMHDSNTIKVFIAVGPDVNGQATITYHYEKGGWKAIDHSWPTGNDYATAPAMIRVT